MCAKSEKRREEKQLYGGSRPGSSRKLRFSPGCVWNRGKQGVGRATPLFVGCLGHLIGQAGSDPSICYCLWLVLYWLQKPARLLKTFGYGVASGGAQLGKRRQAHPDLDEDVLTPG